MRAMREVGEFRTVHEARPFSRGQAFARLVELGENIKLQPEKAHPETMEELIADRLEFIYGPVAGAIGNVFEADRSLYVSFGYPIIFDEHSIDLRYVRKKMYLMSIITGNSVSNAVELRPDNLASLLEGSMQATGLECLQYARVELQQLARLSEQDIIDKFKATLKAPSPSLIARIKGFLEDYDRLSRF